MVARPLPEAALDATEACVVDARAGDAAAFTELVQSYERPVYNLVLGLVRDPSDAEDLAQEVWLKVARSLADLHESDRFVPWLYRIARNCCLDFLRGRRSRPRIAAIDEDRTFDPPDTRDEGPERRVLSLEERRQVWNALGALSERYRTALFLREFEGLSYAQIGQAMGVRRGTAEVLLFRARERFRRQFSTTAETPSACGVAPWQLSAMMDGELPTGTGAELRRHSKGCLTCKSWLRTFETGRKTYLGLGLALVPETLGAAVRAKLAALFGASSATGASAAAGGSGAAGGVLGGSSAAAGAASASLAAAPAATAGQLASAGLITKLVLGALLSVGAGSMLAGTPDAAPVDPLPAYRIESVAADAARDIVSAVSAAAPVAGPVVAPVAALVSDSVADFFEPAGPVVAAPVPAEGDVQDQPPAIPLVSPAVPFVPDPAGGAAPPEASSVPPVSRSPLPGPVEGSTVPASGAPSGSGGGQVQDAATDQPAGAKFDADEPKAEQDGGTDAHGRKGKGGEEHGKSGHPGLGTANADHGASNADHGGGNGNGGDRPAASNAGGNGGGGDPPAASNAGGNGGGGNAGDRPSGGNGGGHGADHPSGGNGPSSKGAHDSKGQR